MQASVRNPFYLLYLVMLRVSTSVASTSSALSPNQINSSLESYTVSPRNKRLSLSTISSSLKKMEYAVRGKVVIAADRINAELKESSVHAYPFDHIVFTNIGNPHSVEQVPLTWPRQVMALVELPNQLGVDHPKVREMFPDDVIERARDIKVALDGYGMGAYTHSQGPVLFRREIARFIEDRDKLAVGSVDPDCIFMTNGASSAINMMLTALITDSTCGVMIPIPQYPIYSATIDLLGGKKVGYYLDESTGWGLNVDELERSLSEAKQNGLNVVAFVLINPGNPTGQVLSRQAVKEVVRFCSRHNLVLLADEVYQENVYDEKAVFFSCKRAAHEIGLLDDSVELVSFHSISKGLFGECGRRGGYMELTGIDAKVRDELYKLASSWLCSNTSGQVMTSLMVRGPKAGDFSYDVHEKERKAIFESLKRRARIVTEGLNSIPGFSCQDAQGAMYCFPSIQLPTGALLAAKDQGISPDTLYAVSLLETTGICVVPASGFGQKEGRYGFRTTFLPSDDEMIRVVKAIGDHHKVFMSKYQ